MILVTGATGNVGSELMKILADAGEPVRGMMRKRRPLPGDAEAVVGDLNDATSVRAAAEGAKGAFLLGGYDDMPGVLAALREAGVEHVALLSSRCVIGGQESNVVTAMHLTGEAQVRASGLAWTFLRPSGFLSNTLRWIPQLKAGDVVREPFADVPITGIDPRDIAAVAAAALTTPGHDGQAYAITGPEPLLPADRLRTLGKVLGRDLTLEGLSNDEARAEMSTRIPGKYVDAFFRFFVGGEFDDSAVTTTVREVTGREPRRFGQWAEEHAEAFTA
ncbi:NAD(P)H-binding protein [Amycolatopsis sp. H20-H5]|uniref:NAD(P)H-binding protein n=1 Tax=Amycolatopsis sp. H20-H5 TaxID=3046309 RepID=UPI002DBF34BA|nr:NAD(P)H-binding protein [Amycolatopsis sp. H20-H5]MEC3973849.1 NAD(P)H-binding protein [Amycolatopsis sp. H20-H5]